MKEKKRITALSLILVALVVIFVGLKIFNAQEERKKQEEEAAKIIRITDLGALQTISYDNGTEEISLKKTGDGWSFTEEPEVVLNQDYLMAMDDEITGLTASEIIEDPDELDAYGLDQPAYTLKVKDEDSKECTIYVGYAADSEYYLTTDKKEKIYTGGATLVSSLQKERNQLVANDTIPSIGSSQVVNVSINSPTDGKTSYTAKENMDDIGTILGGVSALSFDGCVDYKVSSEKLKSYGLNKAARTTVNIKYTDSDSKTQNFKLYIGKEDSTQTYYYVQVAESKIVNKALVDTVKNLLNE